MFSSSCPTPSTTRGAVPGTVPSRSSAADLGPPQRQRHRDHALADRVELKVRAQRGEVCGTRLERDDPRARDSDRGDEGVRADVRAHVVEHLARLQVLLDPADRPRLLLARAQAVELVPRGELEVDRRPGIVEPSIRHGRGTHALVGPHTTQMIPEVAQASHRPHRQWLKRIGRRRFWG